MIVDFKEIFVSPCIKFDLEKDKENKNTVLGKYKGKFVFSIEKQCEREFLVDVISGESSTERSFGKSLAFAKEEICNMVIREFEMEIFN